VAVFFVMQGAHFLAAVQVIVYAGAIVVLFLFVIMLLGVDTAEDLSVEPIAGQRPLAVVAGAGLLGAAIATLFLTDDALDRVAVGREAFIAPLSSPGENIEKVGRALFTDYLFAFEVTSVLLVIAVVAAVVLARAPRASAAELAELASRDAEREEVG
jgi:NADH-quinone oxidoreductase subunit J